MLCEWICLSHDHHVKHLYNSFHHLTDWDSEKRYTKQGPAVATCPATGNPTLHFIYYHSHLVSECLFMLFNNAAPWQGPTDPRKEQGFALHAATSMGLSAVHKYTVVHKIFQKICWSYAHYKINFQKLIEQIFKGNFIWDYFWKLILGAAIYFKIFWMWKIF